jgi:hypothetical protein
MDLAMKQRETNHKVLIIGDSHARGCAAEISDTLEETFEVLGIVCPGAGIDFISTYTMAEILQLTKQDVVIIWGGSNDVAKNEANQGIEKIMSVVESIKHTNIILLEAPCRYDLDLGSCVNKEVRKFNNSLRNLMKAYDHATVLPANSDRSTYIKHGQHMNKRGKELMARKIGEAIKLKFRVCIKESISLKMNLDQNINNNNQDSEATTDSAKGGMIDPINNQENYAQEPEELKNGPIVGKDPNEILGDNTRGPDESSDEVGEGRDETTGGTDDRISVTTSNLDNSTQKSEESIEELAEDKKPSGYLNDSTYGPGEATVEAEEGSDPPVSLMKRAINRDDEKSDSTNDQNNCTQEDDILVEGNSTKQTVLTTQSLVNNLPETSRKTSSRTKKPPTCRTGDFFMGPVIIASSCESGYVLPQTGYFPKINSITNENFKEAENRKYHLNFLNSNKLFDTTILKNESDLIIYHQNIRGLKCKINEFILSVTEVKPHLICITEHHVLNLDLNFPYIPKYKLGASYSRSSIKGGGVCI